MIPVRVQEFSLPEASVLEDALQHGVVKVGLWRLADREPVGQERLEAAAQLSRRGLLCPTGARTPLGAHRLDEEYVPTSRSRPRTPALPKA